MKIILSGSLGHIGQPLATELVAKGHDITVISSQADKRNDIEALGATAAIGLLEDVDFLTETFTGADAVYCMIPPNNYFNQNFDLWEYVQRIGNNYAQAIGQSGVKRLVHLSSIGAHLSEGTGLITAHHAVEAILKAIPGVAITHMRPTAFHYNLYSFIPVIKNTGSISANYGEGDKIIWVSPTDIAAAIADEITTPLAGRKVRYVASDELTCSEVAGILGEAIGLPDLQWDLITQQQLQSRLEAVGMNKNIAAGLAEMQQCMHRGVFFEDYYLHRPAEMGKVKMADFAKEFAAAFEQK